MHLFRRFVVLFAAVVWCWANTATAEISQSKLSAHLIGGYTTGSSNIVAGKPRLLKILDFPPGMVAAMRDYKAKVPEGKVVVRIYSPQTYDLSSNATTSATHFWNSILQPALNSISPADRALIDYLEGSNEGQTPTLGYPWDRRLEASQWLNQFWTNLTPIMVSAGYKPCIGSIAVGNPGGNPADWQPLLAEFVPALRQARAAGGAWSYHSYTLQYTTDFNVEIHDSLRYRQFYQFFAEQFPDLTGIPLVITEGGVDQVGDRLASGWQARGSAANYQRWLNWFDLQMQQDSYVVGCTLFQNGDPWWASFDLETIMPGAHPGVMPIASWLGNYLRNPVAPPAVPGPVTVFTNTTIKLSWTNLPGNPTHYAVRRATNSGGPYTLLADKLSEGIHDSSFVDNAVTGGRTYYYVVSAVNGAGEGAWTAEMAATPGLPNINCGGQNIGSFSDDIFFSGGQVLNLTNTIDTSGATNPAPVAVYQSQRYGNLSYSIPSLLPNKAYRVRLHFCEMYVYFNAPGYRVFNVYINEARVLNNFDIFVAAGGQYKATVQEFNAVSDANGRINVRLETVTDNASINGIEILAQESNSIPSAPSNLTATVGRGHVLLNWVAPPGATRFNVRRAPVGSSLALIATNLPSPTFTDVSFTPNVTYSYAVSALNSFGEGPISSTVSAKPTNALPDAVPVSVSWTNGAILPGDAVFFRVTAKNQGAAVIGANTLGIGLLVDGVQIGYVGAGNASLPPGASATYIANGGPNAGAWIASPGKHTITAVVDDINRFAEGNENNNSLNVELVTRVPGYSVNVGGPELGSFGADHHYDGSLSTLMVTNAIDAAGVPGAAPAAVYCSERWGNFVYTLPDLVPGRMYKARLHFAEISPSVTGIGERQFHVSLNGTQVLANFDIYAAAGAKFRAVTRQFNTAAGQDRMLRLQFWSGAANAPKCSGIEVFPYTNTPPVLASIPNKLVNANTVLSFTNAAADFDVPTDILSFSLVSGPIGAMVSPAGVFSWTAPDPSTPQTNTITIRVADNGSPSLNHSRSFTVVVVPRPRISQMGVTDQTASLTWQTYPGKSYRVEFKEDLADAVWTALGTDRVATGGTLAVSDAIGTRRFYRIVQLD